MNKSTLFSIMFLMASIQGCATLSESECEIADWRLIGLEDGTAGKPFSQIGRHRKACAEYGIKPDLAKYQGGYDDGVRLFCVPRKGFELGKNGRSHHNVCPADLRGTFETAYQDGRLVYASQIAVRDVHNRVIAERSNLNRISHDLAALEAKLVSGTGSPLERKAWLDETRILQVEQAQTIDHIHDLEHEEIELQSEYEQIKSQFSY